MSDIAVGPIPNCEWRPHDDGRSMRRIGEDMAWTYACDRENMMVRQDGRSAFGPGDGRIPGCRARCGRRGVLRFFAGQLSAAVALTDRATGGTVPKAAAGAAGPAEPDRRGERCRRRPGIAARVGVRRGSRERRAALLCAVRRRSGGGLPEAWRTRTTGAARSAACRGSFG